MDRMLTDEEMQVASDAGYLEWVHAREASKAAWDEYHLYPRRSIALAAARKVVEVVFRYGYFGVDGQYHFAAHVARALKQEVGL